MTKRFSSNVTNKKGGEMMKIFGLVICTIALITSAVASYAYVGTYGSNPDMGYIDLYVSDNLISLPQVPAVANPGDPALIFAGLSLSDRLSGYNPETGNGTVYSDFGGDLTACLLGEGYWLSVDDGAVISYAALKNGVPGTDNKPTDMWISLPGVTGESGGWHLIGNPYSDVVPKEWIYFTNGDKVLSWDEASQDPYNWVGRDITGYEGSNGNGTTISMDFGTQDYFDIARGYYVWTNVSNLAMIIDRPDNN